MRLHLNEVDEQRDYQRIIRDELEANGGRPAVNTRQDLRQVRDDLAAEVKARSGSSSRVRLYEQEVLPMRWLAIAAVLLASACTASTPPVASASSALGASPQPPSASAVSAASASATRPAPTATPLTFHNSASQARMVATLIAFLDAYNAGRVDAALALLTPDVVLSDCDYRAASGVNESGLDSVRQWLTGRAADHDQLVLESVENENPDPATGSHIAAVSYTKRTSDTLRSLGFPNGVKPGLATKVVFTTNDDRIRAFANGPGGGSSPSCRATP